ncbi:MAG: ATPase domain-containing protein [Thermomicrobiales bacterium]
MRRPVALARQPTGIAGLDAILRGGLPVGSAYLVAGTPGTGKTTLGNQLAYNHAAQGKIAVIATLVAETHDRMLAHLAGFTFLDADSIGTSVHYLSLVSALEEGGLDGVLTVIRDIVRRLGATLLVVDGTGLLEDLAPSTLDFRRFTAQLQVQSALLGCTTLLLTNRRPEQTDEIATHVDGVIHLVQESAGARERRLLRVAKLRGVGHLTGRHEFAISAAGIVVSPRLEALPPPSAPGIEPSGPRLSMGVAGLDAMLGGGLPTGSSTLLLGNPGAGKTLTGLHYIMAGAARGEHGLIAGFHETPQRLVHTAAAIGLDLDRYIEAGLIHILWQLPVDLNPDAWAQTLLETIATHRPLRLFVDALPDVQQHIIPEDRLSDYVTALVTALRIAGVTSIFASELDTLVGPELRLPIPAVSAALDNGILLRRFELESRLHRLISVIKMRESASDLLIREFAISDGGIAVGEPFSRAAALLTGSAVPVGLPGLAA